MGNEASTPFDLVVCSRRIRPGKRVDRHAPLGDGHIGMTCFELLMKDPRFDDMPLILETPEPERWATEIKTLLGWGQ